jgi:hypothetical protein
MNGMVRVMCPCGSRLELAERAVGRSVQCSACGRELRFERRTGDADTYDLANEPGTPPPEPTQPPSKARQSTFVPLGGSGPPRSTSQASSAHRVSASSFAKACPSVFRYAGQTVLHSIATMLSIIMIMAVLAFAALAMGLIFMVVPAVRITLTLLVYAIIVGYLLAHDLEIVIQSARGDDDVPENPPWDAGTISFGLARALMLVVVYLGPGLAIGLLHTFELLPQAVLLVGQVLFLAGLLCLPIAFVGVSTTAVQSGLRYDLVVGAILANLVPYLLLCLVCVVSLASAGVLMVIEMSLNRSGAGFAPALIVHILAWFALIIGGYTASRAMGLFARYQRERLPFDFD